jgi:hypothetical protein
MSRLMALLALFIVIIAPDPTLADAANGEFMGYRLGDAYDLSASTNTSPSRAGNLHIVAEKPSMPADMGSVRLTATVASRTIGFIDAMQAFESEYLAREFAKKYYKLLRAKYPEWQIDTSEIELSNELRPVALNMNLSPHTIRLKIIEISGNLPFRVSMTLSFLYDGPRWRAWSQLALTEREENLQTSEERLLEESDTLGL